MGHISIFLNIFSAMVFIVCLAKIYIAKKDYNSPQITLLFYFALAGVFSQIIQMSGIYLQNNFPASEKLFHITLYPMSVIIASIEYYLEVRFYESLVDLKYRLLSRLMLAPVSVLLLLEAYDVYCKISGSPLIPRVTFLYFQIMAAAVFLLAAAKLLVTGFQAKGTNKAILIIVASVSLAYTLSTYGLFIASFFGYLASIISELSNTLVHILVNVTIILLVKRFAGYYALSGYTLPPDSIVTGINPALISKFSISPREEEVVQLVMEGLSNQEIAEKLFISVSTVKDHNHRIFRKTGVKNRTQLAKVFSERP